MAQYGSKVEIVTPSRPQTRDASGEVNLGVDTFGGTTGDARAEQIFSNGFGDLGLLADALWSPASRKRQLLITDPVLSRLRAVLIAIGQ